MKIYFSFALAMFTLYLCGCSGGALSSGPPRPQLLPESAHGASTALGIPQAVLSPTAVSLAAYIGSRSATVPVVLSNPGTATLAISQITSTCSWYFCFSHSSNCGTQLAPGKNCTIGISFVPNAAGHFTGTLSVFDNALGSPQKVSLSGYGACLQAGRRCTSSRQCCPGLVCVGASIGAICEPAWMRTGQAFLRGAASRDAAFGALDRFTASDFISVIDLKQDAVVRKIAVSIGANALAMTPDGKKLYVTGGSTNGVLVVDTRRDAVVRTIPLDFGIRPDDVAVAADGKSAIVSSALQPEVSIVDTANGTVMKTVPSSVAPSPEALLRRCAPGVVSSPDGTVAYVVENAMQQ